MLSWPKFVQKLFLGSRFLKSKSRSGISSSKIPCGPIFRENGQLRLFLPKFAQDWILRLELPKCKSGSELALPRYHLCKLSGKTSNFKFFGLNLGKFLNYERYFGSKNVGSVAESWAVTERSCVEVNGTGWSWVHGLEMT